MRSYLKIASNSTWTYAKEILVALSKSSFAIIIVSCILIYYELIPEHYYSHYIGPFILTNVGPLAFYVAYTYLFFVIFPALYTNLFLKIRLHDLAVRLPCWNTKAFIWFTLTLPLALFCLTILAKLPSFASYHHFTQNLSYSKLWFFQLVFIPLYYIAEEFFFRGFLFMTLWKKIGWHSLWITELLFTIAHLGKPSLEILLAIPVGILLNILTLWTRSILPAILFHATMGMFLNFYIYFYLL